MDSVPASDIVTATSFLTGRGLFGVVWADHKFIAVQRFGALVDDIPIGHPITASVLALLGFDDQIEALQRRPSGSLSIPNVQLDSANRHSVRVNIHVYWLSGEQRYLLVLTNAPPNTDVEVALEAQVRARAIAEADATAKSRLIAHVNEELTRANQDLQAFASVISHDLRSPLRRLRYHAASAGTAIEADQPRLVSAHLQQIEAQAKRMAAMLNGLLEYSRIGRKSEFTEMVDTGALATEIIASVPRPAGLEIALQGQWPTFPTLAQPLDIVMRNLIENAVKHHDRDVGTVIVHGVDAPDRLHFSVTDDGPGIPPDWHYAIFEPFKRIADEEEGKDGSGIGLALVKRTVETYGGRIEIQSDPKRGRGTSFRVQWPKMTTA